MRVFNFSILIVLYIIFNISICYANKSTLSDSDLKTCNKEVRNWSPLFYINRVNPNISANENIHIKFYINPSDGNKVPSIFLYYLDGSHYNDEYYKIETTKIKCELGRLNPIKNILQEYKNDGMFSINEPFPIEIVQKIRDGTLLVYFPDISMEPIFNYTDPNPFDIKFVQFLNIYNSEVYHSCQFDDFCSEFVPENKPKESCQCENGTCTPCGNCQCNPGYEHSKNNKYRCEPVCTEGCGNLICTAPNYCSCNEGYQLSKSNKTCEPFCESCCPNGFCFAPGKCGCNEGFFMPTENTCAPVCRGDCTNGHCVAPGICDCNPGYALSTNKLKCDPICQKGCINGRCTRPEVCICFKGHTWSNKNQKCELYKYLQK